MAVAEPCRECGVFDALGRHDGTCPRAIELGLPRLADGEEPIDPIEEASYDIDGDPEPELADPLAADQPGRIVPGGLPDKPDPLLRIARERQVVADYANKVLTGLWMAYHAPGQAPFDAVVFDTEIDALRYAVTEGWQVREVELGRSLAEQAQQGP